MAAAKKVQTVGEDTEVVVGTIEKVAKGPAVKSDGEKELPVVVAHREALSEAANRPRKVAVVGIVNRVLLRRKNQTEVQGRGNIGQEEGEGPGNAAIAAAAFPALTRCQEIKMVVGRGGTKAKRKNFMIKMGEKTMQEYPIPTPVLMRRMVTER